MATILACHGFTGEGADFEPLRAVLPPGHALLAPDFPGHGSRCRQRTPSDYSLAAHLDILDESARNAAEPVTLLGYSMGGRIALHWALANPGKCHQLILVGASPGLPTEAERAERAYADDSVAKYLRTQGLPAFYKYWHNQPFFKTLLALPAARLEPILSRRHQNDPEGLALSLEHVGTGRLSSLWERLRELTGPVDLVTGEHDPKFTEIARRMGERMPKARLSVIEGCGHAIHLERPDDLVQVLR
ncbi:MAG: 2-succinyl-6-hydroxy-2,4-cyclohexadiene-1-carboxylate synthase [Verrucomicrobiae bacterium]|jgi:2-succinyl-6-hydroxy-2,4-cyclohexadiene-1-carboxylate synthase|nr:2-succinyl-6-hydroxy-2,4-cyclohexadiene-1-carboxylate synthase [Verrucomicrobiae bacterium]